MTRALLLAALLVALPLVASAANVFRSPFIPTDMDPKDGTVVLQLSVWQGSTWATESVVVQPAGLPIECGSPAPAA